VSLVRRNKIVKLSTGLSTGFQVSAWKRGRARAHLRAMMFLGMLAAGLNLIPPVAMGEPASEVPQAAQAGLLARAESGDSWAQLNLGAAFDHGLAGFAQDPARAVFWYRRAAEAGLAKAQFNLAHCLATGSGTARDDGEAFSWMLSAAEHGLSSAQFLVGVMLAEGIGTHPDLIGARIWLQRASEAGNSDAAGLLGRLEELPAGD